MEERILEAENPSKLYLPIKITKMAFTSLNVVSHCDERKSVINDGLIIS